MRLTSTQNPTIKYVRSLDRASVRREEGVYATEGARLVGEALDTGQIATILLYDPATLTKSAAGSSLLGRLHGWAEREFEVDERVLHAAASTENPSGVLAVLRAPSPPPLGTAVGAGMGLVLDAIADPGNMGTMLRTAAAFGFRYVVTAPGSADPFAPKVVRAGMGAHFRLPVYAGTPWEDLRDALAGRPVIALDAHGGRALPSFSWPREGVLVVGSEAHGLSQEASALVTAHVRIPMAAAVESLNAAIAAAIAMYAASISQSSSG